MSTGISAAVKQGKRAEARKSRSILFLKLLLCCPAVLLFFCSATLASDFCFEEAGRQYGINPILLESIARIESNLNPKAINKNQNGSVDIGLMQINSFWVKSLGLNADELISNPCYNTMTGAKILKQCIDRYGYTWEAVGCYNATSKPKRVKYSWKIFNRLKGVPKKSKIFWGVSVFDFLGSWSRIKSSESRVKSRGIHNSNLEITSSELYFRVRDKKTEAQ